MNNNKPMVAIKFKIIKYKIFEDNIKLIQLIDSGINLITNKLSKIYPNVVLVRVPKNNTKYDYVCKYNKNYSLNLAHEYINLVFKLVENYIKFNHDNFGTEWYTNLTINIITK